MSLFRRAGAAVARIIKSPADPAAEANRVLFYGKDVAGVTEGFARSSSGAITRLTGLSSGSIAIADVAPGNFDMSVLGTNDWCYPEAYSNQAPMSGLANQKRAGGWIASFWKWSPNASAATTDARAWVNTWTQADNGQGSALAGTRNIPGFNANSLYLGYRMMVPCKPVPQILAYQGTQFGTEILHTARFSDPSIGAPASMTTVSTAISGHDYRGEVTFNGPLGSWLILDAYVSVLVGGNNHIYVGACGLRNA